MMATVIARVMPSTPGSFMSTGNDNQQNFGSTSTDYIPSLQSGPAVDEEAQESDKSKETTSESEGTADDADESVGTTQQEREDLEDAKEADEDDDVGETTVIAPTNQRSRDQRRRTGKRKRTTASEEDDDSGSSGTDASSSEDLSFGNPEWDADDDAEEAEETDVVEGNRCTFCKQLEDEDPSEEFELILTCLGCGDNAHRQCAREADSLQSEDDADLWRCPNCNDSTLELDRPDTQKVRRRSSAPKIARDLLPAQRAVKVGSHSVFNTLILDDDPMDGSRSLRKRKTSNDMDTRPEAEKRLRRSSSEIIVAPGVQSDAPESQVEADVVQQTNQLELTGGTPRSRSSRLRQQKQSSRPHVTVLENSEHRYLLSINIKPALMYRVVDEAKKRKRRARDDAKRQKKLQELEQTPLMEVSHYPAIQSASFTASFLALQDREGNESKTKPYGGILTEPEADNSKTFPQPSDRKKFESARLKAEEDWRRKIAAAAAEQARTSQKISGPPTRIKCIQFGSHEIDTWHSAPYPEEYSRNRVLFICEFCLKYMNSDFVAWRHKLKCPARHPPGDEIYHDGAFSFFEVDGRKNPVYCQNLCLLAKLFLGSKTLYYDVEPFLFYVMTENNEEGCHFVGYFSKEKRPSSQNNVSCILVLPIHQRRGFGHMLIEFSYLLTRVEGKTGSPEKPLSDMGLVSYRNYWRRVLCEQLVDRTSALSITDISDRTGMTADDIVCALEGLRAMVRDPVTKAYALRLDYAYFKQYIENYEKKGYAKINPDALTWVPYVIGRDNSHYETTHIQTVAQRGDDPNGSPPRMPVEGVQLTMNGLSDKNYGESKSEDSIRGTSMHGEDADMQDGDGQTTPFPSFGSSSSRQGSPSKRSRTATNNPSTPQADPGDPFDSPIPPTRFEVYPPSPGSMSRRKSGKGWARGIGRRGTPLRRGSPSARAPDTSSTAVHSTMRRPSKLADMVNGQDMEEADQELSGGRAEAESNLDANAADITNAEASEEEDTPAADQ